MKKRNILTVFITTILCFSVLQITTKASFDYNVKSLSYTHGSVSISSGINQDLTDFGGGSSTADICNYLSFQFDKYYSGTVTLKWSYNSSAWRQNLTDWNILVIGGKIDSNNNTSGNIVFRVYDTDSFMVVMTYSSGAILNGTDPTFNFTSASSSLTAVTNHNELYNNVDNIDSQLSSTNTQLGGIVSLLGALQALQNTISSNVVDISDNIALESDGITNTDIETKLNLITSWIELVNGHLTSLDNNLSTALTNQNTCNGLLQDIEDNTDGVEGILTAIEGTLVVEGVSVFSQLAATEAAILAALVPATGDSLLTTLSNLDQILSDPVNGISKKISDLNTKVNDANTKLEDIKTTLNNILTAVNNIDTQIDTISWVNYTSALYWNNELTGDISTWHTDENLSTNSYKKLYICFNVPSDYYNKIIKYDGILQSNSSYIGLNVKPIGVIISNRYYDADINSYYQYTRNHTSIYVYPDINMPSSAYLVFEVTSDNYVRYTRRNDTFSYLADNDIEYWTLLSYFDNYNYHKRILDLFSVDVDSETSLTIYNNDQTTLNNIDTGLNNEYQTYLPFVNQQIAPLSNTTFLNEMSNQRTLFDYIFRNVFNIDYNTEDPSTVTNPIFLILIFGGILLALVG